LGWWCSWITGKKYLILIFWPFAIWAVIHFWPNCAIPWKKVTPIWVVTKYHLVSCNSSKNIWGVTIQPVDPLSYCSIRSKTIIRKSILWSNYVQICLIVTRFNIHNFCAMSSNNRSYCLSKVCTKFWTMLMQRDYLVSKWVHLLINWRR